MDAARHRCGDLQVLDQRVAESGPVPEELVITAKGAHRTGDVIGNDIGCGWLRDRLVGVADPDIELLFAASLGFGGLGAEVGCYVIVGARNGDVADPIDEILVAVGIRFADDKVALDAVPAGVAAEAPGDRLLHLEHAALLHVVVDEKGIDLVVGSVGLCWRH